MNVHSEDVIEDYGRTRSGRIINKKSSTKINLVPGSKFYCYSNRFLLNVN